MKSRRPKSPYRVKTPNANFGIRTTDTDRDRLAFLARWYCASPDRLVRAELDPKFWDPALTGLPEGEATAEYVSRLRAIKQRLWKLGSVEENPGNHTGPFVGSALVGDGKTAYFATRYGTSVASIPWRFRSSINPQFAAHAWMAADIGMQIERLGYRVLSERELSTGWDRHGQEFATQVESKYVTSSGQSVTKKPDIAVLSADEESFIAVEVERDLNRPIPTYREKLRAYQDNAAIKAVWYVCISETTAARVIAAANDVFQDRPFPLRIYVAGVHDGWHFIRDLESKPSLMSDLEGLQ